jgi:hypothetical protein
MLIQRPGGCAEAAVAERVSADAAPTRVRMVSFFIAEFLSFRIRPLSQASR